MNFLSGRPAPGGRVSIEGGGEIVLPPGSAARAEGMPVTLGVRPEKLRPAPDGDGILLGAVSIVEDMGENVHVHVATGRGETVIAKVERVGGLVPDQPLRVGSDPADLHLFDPESGNRLSA